MNRVGGGGGGGGFGRLLKDGMLASLNIPLVPHPRKERDVAPW